MSKAEQFIFRTLPMLTVLLFSLVTVIISNEKWITIGIMSILDVIAIWWLYMELNRPKEQQSVPEPPKPEVKRIPKKEEPKKDVQIRTTDTVPAEQPKQDVGTEEPKQEEKPVPKKVRIPDDLENLEIRFRP